MQTTWSENKSFEQTLSQQKFIHILKDRSLNTSENQFCQKKTATTTQNIRNKVACTIRNSTKSFWECYTEAMFKKKKNFLRN